MVNLVIFAIVLIVFALTRGRLEGTCRLPGILAGLTFFNRGRVHVVIWSHRPGRIYFRVNLAGG